jgi:TPP-dependent 2-oxoacid decarboxylase
LNKSRVARDLWRKVFNDNLIDLRDADARKQVVAEFLADPINRKEGWKSKDARFMRLGLQSVAKENNFNLLNAGITPTPIRNKTQKGNLNLNVKSKLKKVPEMKSEIPETKEKPKFGALPQTPQLQGQQAQAVYYSAQAVGQIFNTAFNIGASRFDFDPLTQNEIIALGEAWSPIFSEIFGEQNKWIMPVIITLPIVLQRLAQMAKAKKEKELKEKYNMDDKKTPTKTEPIKQKSKWEDMGFGKAETNKG